MTVRDLSLDGRPAANSSPAYSRSSIRTLSSSSQVRVAEPTTVARRGNAEQRRALVTTGRAMKAAQADALVRLVSGAVR